MTTILHINRDEEAKFKMQRWEGIAGNSSYDTLSIESDGSDISVFMTKEQMEALYDSLSEFLADERAKAVLKSATVGIHLQEKMEENV